MDSVFTGTNRAPDGTVTGTFDGTVTNNVYDPVTGTLVKGTNELLQHVSGQIDILNHSAYVSNIYLLFICVNVALIAAVMMFFLGKYVVTTRKGK